MAWNINRYAPTLLLTLAAAAGIAGAQTPPPAVTPPAAAAQQPAASAVADFVDEMTLAVADVDVSAVDVDALTEWFQALLKGAGMPQKELDESARNLAGGAGPLKQWFGRFTAAGGRRVYVVAMLNQQAPVYLVVPVGAGGDAAKLTAALSAGDGGLPKELVGTNVVERVGDALLWGPPPALALAKETRANAKRQARPDLAAALSAGGNAPVRLAFAPPEHMKGLLSISQPRLPAELGGGATAPVVNAFKSLSWAADLPTAASKSAAVRVTIQARDPDGAQKLKALVDAVFASAKKDPGFNEIPDGDRVLAMMTPQVAGDQLTLAMDQPKLETYAKLAVPSLIAARGQAARVRSASNLKNLALATHMYANDKAGNLPAKFPDDLLPYLAGANVAELLANPTQPGRAPGYAFVRPAGVAKMADVKEPAAAVMLYEAHEAWPAGGVNVAFYDGHVELVKDEGAFKKMLGGN